MHNLLYLFINMVGISLVSFGAGTPAFLYQFGVVQTHWITASALSSVLAFGYATPGPAANGAAAFIGYRIGGVVGFGVGALGIFIAPWILSILAARHLNDWIDNPRVHFSSLALVSRPQAWWRLPPFSFCHHISHRTYGLLVSQPDHS